MQVRWSFTGKPEQVIVQAAGGSSITFSPKADSGDDQRNSAGLTVNLSKDGMDFIVSAQWNAPEGPQALKVSLLADGFPPAEKTFWSDAQDKIHDTISLVP